MKTVSLAHRNNVSIVELLDILLIGSIIHYFCRYNNYAYTDVHMRTYTHTNAHPPNTHTHTHTQQTHMHTDLDYIS